MFPLNKKKITHFFIIKIVYVQVDGGEKKEKEKKKKRHVHETHVLADYGKFKKEKLMIN